MFCIDFYKEKAKKKTQLLKNSNKALEWQREEDNRGNLLLGPSVPLEYILGLQIIKLTNKKTKETFQQPIMVESRIIRQNLFSII